MDRRRLGGCVRVARQIRPGHFELGFERLIENGVDIEFIQEFTWTGPLVKVGLDFWANEAVAKTWIHKVSPCTCTK